MVTERYFMLKIPKVQKLRGECGGAQEDIRRVMSKQKHCYSW